MNGNPDFTIVFFRTSNDREPVRKWLKELSKNDRKTIGEDIKLIQFRWPLGMPLVRKLESDLWEIRSHLTHNRISRILFTVHSYQIVLLHGFIKKSRKTPANELKIARSRRDLWQNGW